MKGFSEEADRSIKVTSNNLIIMQWPAFCMFQLFDVHLETGHKEGSEVLNIEIQLYYSTTVHTVRMQTSVITHIQQSCTNIMLQYKSLKLQCPVHCLLMYIYRHIDFMHQALVLIEPAMNYTVSVISR